MNDHPPPISITISIAELYKCLCPECKAALLDYLGEKAGAGAIRGKISEWTNGLVLTGKAEQQLDKVIRSMGYAFLRSSGFETVDEVVVAGPGDLTILGARTLEGFGAVVDAGKKKLAASGPHLAAPGGG